MGERKGMKGLELWCRKVTEGYPGVKIDNMTTSWRDGLAFCAMIHHFRPDLIDFDKLNKEDVYHNNELAFRVAEHHLGIPALLEAEDMVEYEVPDRLSILTYLSQFYQTFEVATGKSGPRVAVKRSQSTPDHGIVSPASTSPPTKIPAPSASRVRREPCAKCKLPVFIAERLNIGKLLYHRTCFKCARCNSQLTLANYYETENGEFCCEVCPDEELSQSSKSEESSVLQRSLSDEEKSASLRKNSDPDTYSTQFESALEYPTDSELRKKFTLSQTDSKARLSFFQSQLKDKSNMDVSNEELPPNLPSSKPPTVDHSNESTEEKENVAQETINKISSFPSESNSKTLDINDSFSVSKDVNFVTKEKLVSPSGSVKARLKLFENLDSKQKSDSDSNVHLVKSRAKVVNLSDLEDFDNISKKETDSDEISINSERNSIQKSDSGSQIPETVLENQNVKRFSSTKRIDLQFNPNDDTQSRIPGEANSSANEILDSSVENSVYTIESDSGNISLDLHLSSVIEISDPSVINISDSTEEGNINGVGPEICVQSNSLSAVISDDSYLSAKEDRSKCQNTELTQAFITARNVLPSSEIVSDVNISSLQTQQGEDEVFFEETESNNQCSDNIVEAVNPDFKNNHLPADHDDKKTSLVIQDILEKDLKEVEPSAPDNSVDTPWNKPSTIKSTTKSSTSKDIEYPDEKNPFGDEDEESNTSMHQESLLNPFDEDTEEEEQPSSKQTPVAVTRKKKIIFPKDEDRICYASPEHLQGIFIQRISINPFEVDEQLDDGEEKRQKPTPSPRQRRKIIPATRISLNPFESEEEEEEQEDKIVPVPQPRNSRSSSNATTASLAPTFTQALSPSSKSSHGGSTSSISSGSAFGSARKKKPAPRPPLPNFAPVSLTSSPCGSVVQSPVSIRSHGKAKRAPPPPRNASTPFEANRTRLSIQTRISPITFRDEDKAEDRDLNYLQQCLDEDFEKRKTVKDEENRNRQSQNFGNGDNVFYQVNTSEIDRIINNKSTHGKWKRQKGKAPSRPIPQRRIIKSLPLSEIRRELDTIEIQQQGLEKQGVRLEQIIREKCEGSSGDATSPDDSLPIDVEDLILQLFELVNEKNELFRRQAELMYLRRQQRLEEEHADVEYQIRCLMLQPEANKTDSDKAREEALINRLVEIVERRNEIIECLEMDRIRETEEDDSISNQLNLYSLKRESGDKEIVENVKKHSKKEKKLKKIKIPFHLHKHKEKGHKVELDKDVDTTEANSGTLEKKKKKKFNLF